MSQSLTQIYIHVVFSTKNRKPILNNVTLRKRLYEYIKKICDNHECHSLAIGGISDHLHILIRLNKKIALSFIVEKIKSSSSKWMKNIDNNLNHFYWQSGYGAFSVSHSSTDKVISYINNQEIHHKKISFQEELINLFHAHRVRYDAKYLWIDK